VEGSQVRSILRSKRQYTTRNDFKMTKKTSPWKRVALLAACVAVGTSSTASAGSYALYELHTTGSIWGYTGVPCNQNGCTGWVQLDDNSAAIMIVAGGGSLFQLHSDGVVWKFTGIACSGSYCPGWQEIDNEPNNPVRGIYGAAGTLYEERADHSVWTFTGQICSGSTCPGWRQLDNSPQVGSIFAGASGLFETRVGTEGQDTLYSFWKYLGTPCSGGSCPGWAQIDMTGTEPGWIAVGYSSAYELAPDDNVRQFTGQPCGNNGCPGWLQVGSNQYTQIITAAKSLFQMQQTYSTNTVWQYNGTPCGPTGCNGWVELDANPAIYTIVAGGSTVYEQHFDGSVWQSTGQPCGFEGGCPGWTELDHNPLIKFIVPN
jgi:hypothetical protein